MAVHFSPKILGLNIGQFGTVFYSLEQPLSLVLILGTGVFEFCCVFGVWGCF